jgi:negative regulator of sigma E activity
MTRLDENALLRSQLAELEVSLQALKEENAMLRDERRIDNEEAARLYDFARDKGAALERAAVVAWLRVEPWSRMLTIEEAAACIERGEHRREEEP